MNHPRSPSSQELDDAANTSLPDASIPDDAPSLDEVQRAIRRLRYGRAAGADDIPPELLKCAIYPVSRALHGLFCTVWKLGKVPAEWKEGIVLSLFKGKGSQSECSSYRPIILLSVPGKVFAHVLLDRLDPLLQKHRQPHQSGFTCCRSTLDAILALCLLAEIYRKFQQPLHVAFVDLKAAFDSVDRLSLIHI